MTFTLRDYQEECHEAIRFGHQEHDSVAVELATGLGKTVIFTRYAKMWNEYARENHRCMVIAPMIQLLGQAGKKIQKETGHQPAIEQADQWSDERDWARSDFIVASKQSLCSGNGTKRYERFTDVGLVIVDEAHYAATESYAEMLRWFQDRGAKVLGVSATLRRHDKRALGQLFGECSYQYGIQEAIADGWLVPVKVTVKQLEKMDLSAVGTTNTQFGRDFNGRQLMDVLENPEVIYEIAEAVAQETEGEKTAIFCASVDEAQAVSELLADNYGIKAGWICADTKRCTKQQRAETLASFEDPGGITHLANVGILTTGWDFPPLNNLVMARPTKSKPLYTQMFGRITRPLDMVVDFDGSTSIARQEAIRMSNKPYGRVIDLVDNSLSHKIQTAADVLGGRWELLRSGEPDTTCRFCLRSFANKMLLSLHVSEEHPEEAMKAQLGTEVDENEHDKIMREKLRKQRAEKRAQARFNDVQVDPFGGRVNGERGRTQSIMATDKQRRYLWVLGVKDIDQWQITKAQAGRMISQLKDGRSVDEVRRTNRSVA